MLSFFNNSTTNDLTSKYDATRVYAVIPSETNCTDPSCGWNDVTQSAKRMDCPTCHGIGKIIVWQTYAIWCRLVWSGLMKLDYSTPSSGIEIGDCLVTVNLDFKVIIESVMNSERSYLVADGKKVKPHTMNQQNVVGMKEYEFVCKTYTPSTD